MLRMLRSRSVSASGTLLRIAPLPADPFAAGRKLYALLPPETEKAAEAAPACPDDERAKDCFPELLQMLTEADAIVRILAASAGSGAILISLPDALTLRLRSILSMAFPGLTLKALGGTAEPCCLPGERLAQGVAGFFYALLRDAEKKREAVPFDEDEGEPHRFDDDSPCTPIEELNLSLRAYSCLKRAGIYSVEELRTMSDEALQQLRNLGRKSLEEIRQKLAARAAASAPIPPAGPGSMEMLEALIGLGEVKAQVKRFAAFARMKKAMAACGREAAPLVLNMAFTGNPGTAKTTVARILAGALHEAGLLSENGLVEVGRADLVAKYEGQTADKVKEVFKRAKGRLLFIDEAYALLEEGSANFGDEAISSIVQEMENNREDTVVIFAGYPDEMAAFFARNPGLRSRVPFSIRFDDYSAEELLQITEREARLRGFSLSGPARGKAALLCRLAAGRPELGNGRFSRNLAESAVLAYAERVYGGEAAADGDFILGAEDFALPHALREDEKAAPIGF